jgi:diacylglycerol kinase (ATP)
MRYAILTNPVSGRFTVAQKRKLLASASRVLNAEVIGLDVKTREEFAARATEVASSADVLVVAGGDGSVSDVINAVDTHRTTISYLPMGSGNAFAYGLGCPSEVSRAAMRIKEAKIRDIDLIDCSGRKRALIASVGIEGKVLKLRNQYVARGGRGFPAYFRAFVKAYFSRDKLESVEMELDGVNHRIRGLLSLMIAKHPYYGYGMKLLPQARLDDGKLHILCTTGSLIRLTCVAMSAFTVGNRFGRFFDGENLVVRSAQPLTLQTDGELAWESDLFTFKILPKSLKVKG